jgi:hypothetical protein
MTTSTDNSDLSSQESKLDDLLAELASAYEKQPVPAHALERLRQRFEQENRIVSDEDLEWLAAAGTGWTLADKNTED